ncbi:MAG: DNA (cytosine-5-)-methyltransferase [Candidatus Omnitrophica bacterium]|nr:DNA (cytosine-5-)-methyltransferase [Candidatus Omnitrophota bacterium]
MTNREIFKLGELFCGPGGLAYAAKCSKLKDQSGKEYLIEHAWATDCDESTCNTYAHNICGGDNRTVICADIRKIKLSKITSLAKINALAFGFPCNDFSTVGEQRGVHGSFGPLYQYGIDVLNECRPKWFLAENVGGLRSANQGNAFGVILKKMYDSGYSIYPHYYSFDNYGVPQARRRIIIVGIRNDFDFEFRIPSSELYSGIDVSCKTALECPPIQKDAFNHEITKQSSVVVQRLKYIKFGQNAFTAKLPQHLRLNVKGAKISQIYKRLDPKKPAYTLTGSGGGGTHMYHWTENRALTNRERARIQTFPDDYRFFGSKEEVRRQIGMAVPCRGAQVVFEAILKTFAKVDYPYIAANLMSMRH